MGKKNDYYPINIRKFHEDVDFFLLGSVESGYETTHRRGDPSSTSRVRRLKTEQGQVVLCLYGTVGDEKEPNYGSYLVTANFTPNGRPVDSSFTFALPGAHVNSRQGTDIYFFVDKVSDQFQLWFKANFGDPVPCEVYPKGTITNKDLEFETDDEGCMIDGEGNIFYCSNEACESPATERVVVSENRPHDSTRNYCDSCYNIYLIGVQHGRYHEAGVRGFLPGRESAQDVTTIDFKGLTQQKTKVKGAA